MITLSSAMLVTLGFLLAALVLIMVLPAYRRRIERFASDAVKRQLPLTEDEIRADRDRMRADYAINIHKLESKLEDAQLSAARQSVEINRRDARVQELDEALASQRLTVEELRNARRVLEQAILDRLPKVEQRLAESRKLLSERDADITLLSDTSAQQTAALQEQTQINIQQSEELNRLRTTLATRASRNRETVGDPRFDGEVALRSEIEMLRAKSRDQNALIVRLQAAASDTDANSGTRPEDIERLRADLSKAEAELLSLKAREGAAVAGRDDIERKMRGLEFDVQDRAAEIARLKAALTSYDKSGLLTAGAAGQAASLQTPPALSTKAEMSALQAEVDEQRRTIQSLRAELASGNERLARQSQHFSEELKRLGNGVVTTADANRRTADAEPRRPSLADRITTPRSAASAAREAGRSQTPTAVSVLESGGEGRSGDARPVGGHLKAVAAIDRDLDSDMMAAGADDSRLEMMPDDQPSATDISPRRPRLLERINSLDKSR
ncbi:MAG: hypothetical protein K2X41_08775 [Hyphomicrobium sp.]|nr:hypothetical protein [Hyphomicrobium sp.]